jgi:hypothetical protein
MSQFGPVAGAETSISVKMPHWRLLIVSASICSGTLKTATSTTRPSACNIAPAVLQKGGNDDRYDARRQHEQRKDVVTRGRLAKLLFQLSIEIRTQGRMHHGIVPGPFHLSRGLGAGYRLHR